jgi:drug/metabolite transporter (DMT)-like permease
MSPLASASSNPLRGILCSLAGIFLLTTSDAGVKWLTDTLPFGEVLFIRTLFAMFAIALIVWHRGGIASLHIVSPRNLAVRALFGTGSTFIIVASLSLLPIGEVLTMVFVTPLLVAALATPLLGERVGWHRWLAILAGFAGVVIMLRPGAETFLAFSILGLLAASLATLPFGWRPPGAIDIAIAGASGLLFGAAHYLMIEGYRHAEASLVAPFRYTNLIWAPLWGFVLWHEVPGIGLLTGAPLIAAGGLYVLYRERADRKALPVAPVQYPESEFRDP